VASISPYLLYSDVDAMLDWLTRAFGLTETMRVPGPDGQASHAEMEFGDGLVMMGCPGPEYRNPKRLGAVTALLFVNVDDVEAHYARAKAAGAEIVTEVEDKPFGRTYAAKDPEGHQWHFAEPPAEANRDGRAR
jgi:PhnB protein